jgi:hypothetical protein
VTTHSGLISSFNTSITFAEDRVYATSGAVVDVSMPGQKTGTVAAIRSVE